MALIPYNVRPWNLVYKNIFWECPSFTGVIIMWIVIIVPAGNFCVGFHIMATVNELVGLGINVSDGDMWYLYPRTLHKTGFMLSIRNIAAVWIIEFKAGTFNVVGICTNANYTQREWPVCMIFRRSLHIKKTNALYVDHVTSVLCQSVTWYLKLYPWTVLHILQRGCLPEVVGSRNINLLKTNRNLPYIRNEPVPRSKHFPPRL